MIENQVYVCTCCGEYCLIASFYLKTCPKRPCDNSFVIDEDIKNCKNSLETSVVVIVKRLQGYEKQYRLSCSNCNIWIGYHQMDRFLYILENALVRVKT